MDESEAIALLKGGDLRGLEELVRRHQVKAIQTAYLIVGDRFTAEDIAQAAFLRIAERIHQFKDGRPFRPWFLRIVKNDAIKAALRAERHVPLETAEERGLFPLGMRNPGRDPEDLTHEALERGRVWEALFQLTPKQRAAIVMRYFLGMEGPDISEALNRSLASVKWSLHAAKWRLRSILGSGDVAEGRDHFGHGPKSDAGGE